MSGAVMKAARPAGMRGALMGVIKKNMVLATGLAIVNSAAWWWLVVKKRKDDYTNFHKNFDPDAMFQRQLSRGVFWYADAGQDE